MRFLILVILSGLLAACTQPSRDYGYSASRWSQLKPAQKSHAKARYKALQQASQHWPTLSKASPLQITVDKGTVYFADKKEYLPYKKVQVDLAAGTCQWIAFVAKKINDRVRTRLCYDGRSVYFDPSITGQTRLDHVGTLVFVRHKEWRQGYAYLGLYSQGILRGKLINVTVKEVS